MIYLDNSATTQVDPEVLDAMLPYLREEYGNPSSRHYTLAKNAERAVEQARENLAKLIHCSSEEIIFTSGASESNNFIIKGVADYKKFYEQKGNHIITSKVEHKSVLQSCKYLNGEVFFNKEQNKTISMFAKKSNNIKIDRGYDVSFLDVNECGQVTPSALTEAITDSTILISLIWGNNELGSLNNIHSLSSLSKERGILFHSDATQVLGKIPIDVESVPVDFLSFSAHKLYAPKGVGAAYIRKGKYSLPNLTALIHGGLQENGYRAGTHAVHNIVGFGKAAEIALRDMKQYVQRITDLENQLKSALNERVQGLTILSDPNHHIPGVVGFLAPGKINELYLARKSDCLSFSSGSACSIGEPSYVIDAIGKSAFTSNFFRVSLGKHTTQSDIQSFIDLFCS